MAKCAAYLQRQVGVLILDVVTDRRANLHQELLELLDRCPPGAEFPALYAVAYRNSKANGQWHLDTWPAPLQVGAQLPTLPLWLASNFSVPLDLETSYEETSAVLRID